MTNYVVKIAHEKLNLSFEFGDHIPRAVYNPRCLAYTWHQIKLGIWRSLMHQGRVGAASRDGGSWGSRSCRGSVLYGLG